MSTYVYIAAPYTTGDVVRNVRRAILAGDELSRCGLVPFIPHLTHLWHLVRPHDYDFWMDLDMAWLEKCDCLVRLDGESPGAGAEVIRAIELGKPVYLSVHDCLMAQARKDE